MRETKSASPLAQDEAPTSQNGELDLTTDSPFNTLRAEVELLRTALYLPATDAAHLLGLVDVDDFCAEHTRIIFEHLLALVTQRAATPDGAVPLAPEVLLLALDEADRLRPRWPIWRILPDILTGDCLSVMDARIVAAELRTGRLRRVLSTLAEQFRRAADTGDADDITLAVNYAAWLPQLTTRALTEETFRAAV